MTPAQAARNRLGGFSNAAKNDPVAYTARARQTFRDSFDLKVDPDGILSPAERARRSQAAYNAHFARMALTRANNRARQSEAASIELAAASVADGDSHDATG